MKKILFIITLLFINCLAAKSQNQDVIKGTVKDKYGEALPGVTIAIREFIGIGTISDVDGKYTLQLPDKATKFTLVYSFVGMKTKEVKVVRKRKEKAKKQDEPEKKN